jgi:predicted GIY-YIG superfamily endonuclease
MPSWAYMLLCADGSFYTGCTTDLDTRFGQHQAGTFGGAARAVSKHAPPPQHDSRRAAVRRSSA